MNEQPANQKAESAMQPESALQPRALTRPWVKDGKTILSGVDPVRRAEKIADAAAVRERTLYFCPSPLYGYGLSRLLSRLEKVPSSAVLCVESDSELFRLSKESIEPFFDNKKLHITNICDAASLVSLVSDKWGARAFRRVEVIRLTGGWQLFSQLYDSLYNTLFQEIATDWGNALTLTKLGRLYIRNALRNIAGLSHFYPLSDLSLGDEAQLKQCSQQRAVLVFGAGPSLDETLDALCGHFPDELRSPEARSFKIICVDTCLGALKDRGVVPDLAVILESQHWNLSDFIGCRGWNVPVAADLSCLPASAGALGGKKGYLFMTPWTTLRIFDRLKNHGLLHEAVPPLGSVGLTAVEIARRVSRGVIICAGLDFSFTSDKYHCKGAPGYRSQLNRQTRFSGLSGTEAYKPQSFGVSSKSGIPVFSSPVMRHYLDVFRREFSAEERLFDIEGTGLPLGLKTLSMREVIDLLKIKKEESPRAVPREAPLEVHAEHDVRLTQRAQQEQCAQQEQRAQLKQRAVLISFFECELKRIEELRGILTGDSDNDRLCALVDECDYLCAHFPDYAGGRRSNTADVSFLKRIRAEIDPMIKLLEHALQGTGGAPR